MISHLPNLSNPQEANANLFFGVLKIVPREMMVDVEGFRMSLFCRRQGSWALPLSSVSDVLMLYSAVDELEVKNEWLQILSPKMIKYDAVSIQSSPNASTAWTLNTPPQNRNRSQSTLQSAWDYWVRNSQYRNYTTSTRALFQGTSTPQRGRQYHGGPEPIIYISWYGNLVILPNQIDQDISAALQNWLIVKRPHFLVGTFAF